MKDVPVRQIMLSKYLFLKAQGHWDLHNSMACGLTISLLQDAVEMLLWTVVKDKSLRCEKGRNTSFPELLGIVGKHLHSIGKELSIQKMETLNTARVGFKHCGNLPDPSDGARFLTDTEEFLAQLVGAAFSVKFEDISLADLIENQEIRERVKDAERHLNSSEFNSCIEECAKAAYLVDGALKRILPEVDRRFSDVSVVFEGDQSHGIHHAFEYIAEYLRSLRTLSIAGLLGVPLNEYARFHEMVPSVMLMGNGDWRVRWLMSKPDSRDDASFSLNYALNYALTSQERAQLHTYQGAMGSLWH
jgi:hypothetical protein